eukprot:Lankesteria_metandrocarpae@DN4359_c0_g1_i1.p1
MPTRMQLLPGQKTVYDAICDEYPPPGSLGYALENADVDMVLADEQTIAHKSSKSFKKCDVLANVFRMDVAPDLVFYRSSVEVKLLNLRPGKLVKPLPRWIHKKLVGVVLLQHGIAAGDYGYDDAVGIVTVKPLHNVTSQTVDISEWKSELKPQEPVPIPEEESTGPSRPIRPRMVEVVITPFPERSREVQANPNQDIVGSGLNAVRRYEEITAAMSMLVFSSINLNKVDISGRMVCTDTVHTLEGTPLAIRMGVYVTPMLVREVATQEVNWMCNVNVSGKVVVARVPALTMVSQILRQNLMLESNARMTEEQKKVVNWWFMREEIEVLCRYPYRCFKTGKQFYRKYSATGLGAPANEQLVEEEDTLTIADYFREKYNIRLQHPCLPCVNVSKDNRQRYIPLELLEVIERSTRSSLNASQRSKVVGMLAMPPQDRLKQIVDIRGLVLGDKTGKSLSAQGINVGSEPVCVKAEILKSPSILYNGNKQMAVMNGRWNLRNLAFYAANREEKQWLFLAFKPRLDECKEKERKCDLFAQNFVQEARSKGLSFGRPTIRVCELTRDTANKAVTRFAEQLDIYKSQHDVLPDLVVVANPYSDGPERKLVYSDIKSHADPMVPTQFFNERMSPYLGERSKGELQWLGNLLMKVQAKTTGSCHALGDATELGTLMSSGGPCLVLGADVTHPCSNRGDNMQCTPSVAAVVSSFMSNWGEFDHTTTLAMPPKTEIIQNFKGIITKILDDCEDLKGKRPGHVFYLRDGVSDGHFHKIVTDELIPIHDAFKSKGWQVPKITCVVVQKRHKFRLFPKDIRDTKNVEPGTFVLDLKHPSGFPNFWLVPHSSPKGTARPSRYFVLRNDLLVSEQIIGQVCYQYCYLFQRFTGSVSYPAPVYNAHLAAERGKQHIQAYMTSLPLQPPSTPDTVLAQCNALLKRSTGPGCRYL